MTGPTMPPASPGSVLPGRLLLVAVAAAAAGSAFHRAFGYRAVALPVLVAAVVPVVLAFVLTRSRRSLPPEVSLLLSTGLWLVLCAVVVHRAHAPADVAPALRRTLDTAVNGWTGLLDTSLPAAADPVLLSVPFTTTWIAATAGAELAVRTRSGTLAPVPSLAVLVAAVAVCLPGHGSLLGQAVALALVCAAALVRRRPGLYLPRDALKLTAWPLLITVVAASTTTGLWQTRQPRYDPRDQRRAEVGSVVSVHPLAQFADWERRPAETLFTVDEAGAGRWRLAALTAYDGRQWTPHGSFTPVSGPLPPSRVPAPVPDGQSRAISVTIGHLTGRLLPLPETPLGVRGGRLSFNRFERALLSPAGLTHAMRYRTSGGSPAPVTPLRAAGLRPARTPAAALDVPGATPASLRALAARAHASARTPYGRARALATELEDGYVRAAGSPVSQSIGSLSRFMSSRKGSAVDFAAAFTLAAQLNGLPSRIVVGFRVPE
ncbi:transglutaminaseTgpA domain-containing protein, partial [Streptomyces sp. MCAF7]